MDSAVKMVFYGKSRASSIVLWNKIFGQLKLRIYTSENIYGTRPKFMTFELTVVSTNTRDNLNNSWNFSLNATFSPFKWFIVIIFYLLWAILSKVIFFYAEKDFYKLVYEYVRICLLKRKFVNIKFLPSIKFYFVCRWFWTASPNKNASYSTIAWNLKI